MILDEAIKHAVEVAGEHERRLKVYENLDEDRPLFKEEENACKKCAEEHKQLAEWLRELKAHREIHDVLLQLLVDLDLDICCDDLSYDEEEERICKENCDLKEKSCWVRWAKMKAREKDKVADVIKDTPTFDQRVLSTPCKSESEDTMKEQEGKTITIPKNATNGEVLKMVFPKVETRDMNGTLDFIEYTLDGIVGTAIEKKWWESPYKAESEDKE